MKQYGQYFTTNANLQNKVYDFILNKPNVILEPSVGRGDLVHNIKTKVKFDMYEIDNKIDFIINKEHIVFGNFLDIKIDKKYKTIIGNPPYVKTKQGNLYIDFVKKCFNLLENKGELIFIVPSAFFKLTSAKGLLSEMVEQGYFSHVYHPNDEHLFENAFIDVVVFRYCKNPKKRKKTLYNGVVMHQNNTDGLITFTNELNDKKQSISTYFDVYVGLVSGKEDVYKTDIGNIDILNKENVRDKYIFVKTFPSENKAINKYLEDNKDILLTRKIKKFNKDNWYEWGAPRNISMMEKHIGEPCIYVKNVSRDAKIAFIGNVEYFGGSLLMLKPNQKVNLNVVVDYLNNDVFKKHYMYSGRFKIGQRQLKMATINCPTRWV